VSWAIAGELNRRLYGTLEQTTVNAVGWVRWRVAAHLLDLTSAKTTSAAAYKLSERFQEAVLRAAPFRPGDARSPQRDTPASAPNRVICKGRARHDRRILYALNRRSARACPRRSLTVRGGFGSGAALR
jgi:hypothetical protein